MINRDNYASAQRYLTYLRDVKQNDPLTLDCRRQQLRHLLEWADEKPFVKAPEVRPTFPKYLNTARNDGKSGSLSRSSQVATCGVVQAFFNWLRTDDPSLSKALTDGWIDTIRPGRLFSSPKKREIFSLDDVRQVLTLPAAGLVDRRDKAAVAFLFLSAMRVRAFVTLSLDCLDLSARQVRQWPSLGVQTKQRKTATTHLLPLDDLLVVVQEWDGLVRAQLPPEAMWYAPIDNTGSRILASTAVPAGREAIVSNGIRRLCEKAGVPYHSPHKLRHGHAVYALGQAAAVADFKAVSQNLMHSNLSTTDGIYGMLTDHDVAGRIAALGAQPGPSPLGLNNNSMEALAALIADKMLERQKAA